MDYNKKKPEEQLNNSSNPETEQQLDNQPSASTFEEDQAVSNTYSLSGMASQVPNLSADIAKLIDQKNWQKAVKNLIVRTIVAATDGNLHVPEYNRNNGKKQEVLIYQHTHWKLLAFQAFSDFVKECVTNIGLPDLHITDSTFMNGLENDVAYSLARHVEEVKHEEEVRINLQNGTLTLNRNGDVSLLPHNREDHIHYVLPYAYDPDARCDRWQAFLDKVMPDHDEQKVLAEYLGLCFTRGIKFEKMLVLYGHGSNGKSVVMDIAEALMGSANVSHVQLSSLTNDEKMRCEIEYKLVNISTESDRALNASVLKMLVSGEPVMGYKNYFGPKQLTDYGKLITSFNSLPLAENTQGFYRRFLILLFKVTITDQEADLNFSKKLMVELPGILNWVIEGLKRFLVAYKFTHCELCDEALRQYRKSSDVVRLFIDECCETDDVYPTNGADLYQSFRNYCYQGGFSIIGRNIFYNRLEALGIVRVEKQRQILFYLRVKSDYERKL